jgi:3-methylcrotonyl-CoA carboxylase alpha subunit
VFNKILIANRGEIACRINRTAHTMGVRTVAVYSDADRRALHVQACDEAVHIGGSAPGESYLLADTIITAALNTGTQAIHPGFGFLSENADFAEACANNNLVFIGPKPEAIRSMGSKSAARQIMQAAGVPVLPGYDGDAQSESKLLAQARLVGFPLLIKAVFGGGGKGLRTVEQEADFLLALESVKRESMGAFGDDTVLLERYLPSARHIEIQIFADTHGNTVHLFERDCSLQRRHQKVIEEAPAPGLDAQLRADMNKAAILCAEATDYVGAGTVEFLLAPDNAFYFMEMNTRLQVEHPVTEMITRQDLVAWQFKIAAGEVLPADQASLSIRGHAIEARIYAESPEFNFLPSTGKLDFLRAPETSRNIRVDTGIKQGDRISAYYDPMIAKLICRGDNREQALARLASALRQYLLIGPKSNITFLSNLCEHPAIVSGGTNTRFIDTHLDELIFSNLLLKPHALVSAAVFTVERKAQQVQVQQRITADPWSPWATSDGWRVTDTDPQKFSLQHGDDEIELTISKRQNLWEIDALGEHYQVELLSAEPNELNLLINGSTSRSIVIQSENKIRLLQNNTLFYFKLVEPGIISNTMEQQKDSILSPMPGKIIACFIREEQTVNKGDPLMIIEAMKMEHSIQAPHDGEIENVFFAVDDQVEEGEILLAFKE